MMKYHGQRKSLFGISILGPIYFFLFRSFSIVTAGNPAATYDPTDNIALDCGSSGNSTASDGRTWTGDVASNLATILPLHTTITAKPIRQAPVDIIPYLTARLSSSQFTYTIPVTAGPKFLRLHFFPSWYPGFDRSKAMFSVKSGPYTFLSNFRPDLVSDSMGVECFVKEFCFNVGENQLLSLTFIPFPSSSKDSYAFVNGIEIVSTPPNLYYTPPGAYGIPFIGQTSFYEIERSTALETMHRLDVGGQSISPAGDSGLFRFWSDDKKNFMGGGVVPQKANNTIKYTKQTPAFIAPADVYQAYRSMGPNKTWNMRNNLTWELPVDLGFKYLVRLHLCETDPDITQASDRLFIIYIDGQMVEYAADAISWSGGNSRPAYRDYLAMIGFEGTSGKYNLSIDLHARDVFTRYSDAILNGIEIFKLNNTAGSLGEPNSEPPGRMFLTEPSQLTGKASSNNNATFIAVGVFVTIALVLLSLRISTIFKDHGNKSKFIETKAPPFPGEVRLLFSESKTKEFTSV